MSTKISAAGNLYDYMDSPTDSIGEEREQIPRAIRGQKAVAKLYLDSLMAPWVRKDKKRRYVGHCERHLLHVINGFSESQQRVERIFPQVLQGTEGIFLAGLPKDALNFVCYEHGKEHGTHAHTAVSLALMPEGGPFEAQIPAGLLPAFDWLISHWSGLPDPLDPTRARVLSPGKFSNKKINEKDIRKILAKTHEAKIKDHQAFLSLLKREGYTILAGPDRDDKTQLTEAGREIGYKPRKHGVAVQTSDGRQIIFTGLACHFHFNGDRWHDEYLPRRAARHQHQLKHPDEVFDRFVELFDLHRKSQQDRYPLPDTVAGRSTITDYLWLKPGAASRGCRIITSDLAEDPTAVLPDHLYPFYSDDRETIWPDEEEQFVRLTQPWEDEPASELEHPKPIDLDRPEEMVLIWPRMESWVTQPQAGPLSADESPPKPATSCSQPQLPRPLPAPQSPEREFPAPDPSLGAPRNEADRTKGPANQTEPPASASLSPEFVAPPLAKPGLSEEEKRKRKTRELRRLREKRALATSLAAAEQGAQLIELELAQRANEQRLAERRRAGLTLAIAVSSCGEPSLDKADQKLEPIADEPTNRLPQKPSAAPQLSPPDDIA